VSISFWQPGALPGVPAHPPLSVGCGWETGLADCEMARNPVGYGGILKALLQERKAPMPLIQGGPPQWVWERSADFLKSEVVPVSSPEGHTVYELRVSCGLEVLRVQFLTREELKDLESLLAAL